MSGVERVPVSEGEAGARLDRWFKRRYPHISHGRLEKLLRTGQVRVDGARAKAGQRLDAGQEVRVPPLAPPDGDASRETQRTLDVSAADAERLRSWVIYEDDVMIALNKPSGLAVQGGAKTTRHLDGLLPALAGPDGAAPRLAHRLDRDTSGVLVVGKTPAATAGLARAFATRQAEKTYWAVTVGAPTPRAGLIKGHLRKGTPRLAGANVTAADKERMIAARHGEEGAVYARTRYFVLATAASRAAWVALRPETGRTHQLRAHMAMVDAPIVGDRKYRGDRPTPGGLADKLHLHARSLRLDHPAGRGVLELTAPAPAHLLQAFDALGFTMEDAVDPFAEA